MKTPNLDKASEVKELSQTIDEFIEWLHDEKEIDTCRRLEVEPFEDDTGPDYYGECPVCGIELDLRGDPFIFWWPAYANIQEWLAEFFGIDHDEMERERTELLLHLRDQQGGD